MIVYRIEGSDGDGPYSGYGSVARQIKYSHQDLAHVPPQMDGIGWIHEDYEFCGMSTYDRLRSWFEGVWHLLISGSYSLVTYEVPVEHVRFGVLQLVFNREEAVKLGSSPVSEVCR